MKQHHPRIVVLGGGTGTFTILSGLKKVPSDLTAIVSMSDNGGSTGVLRDELGVLPPGDVRQCLVALSEGDSVLRKLFTYRFSEGSLAGHNFGNLFLSVLEKISGDPLSAVREAQRILDVRGNVIPVSAQASNLHAHLQDGTILEGEHMIDEASAIRSPIDRCFLSPAVSANPAALDAIRRADLIVLGPGDLYTSIIPVLLVDGVTEALAASKAKLAYVLNLVTKHGQTDGYTAKTFCRVINDYVQPARLDTVLVNRSSLPADIEARYAAQAEFAIPDDIPDESDAPSIVRRDLIARGTVQVAAGDRLRRSFLRHDPDKLARAVLDLL